MRFLTTKMRKRIANDIKKEVTFMTNNKYPDIQLANFRDLGGYRNADG